MERDPVRWFAAVSVAWAVVLVDQLAKLGASRLDAQMVARNRDGAFGVIGGPRPLLVSGSIVAMLAFLTLVGRWAVHIGISPFLPAVITGGMLANMLDRVAFGSVRDFLVTPWALINVADVAVIVGIAGLAAAVALRVRELRLASCTVTLDMAKLRVNVVRSVADGASGPH